MGSFFSKKKKKEKAEDDSRTGSAPSRMESWQSGEWQSVDQAQAQATAPTSEGTRQEPATPLPDPPASAPASEITTSQSPIPPKPAATEPSPVPELPDQALPASKPEAAGVAAIKAHSKPSSREGERSRERHTVDDNLLRKFYDKETVNNLTSSVWGEREQALKSVKEVIVNQRHGSCDPNQLYESCCSIVYRALRDKVAPVYFAALDVLDAAVQVLVPVLRRTDVQNSLDYLAPLLVQRSGNINARISNSTSELIRVVARNEKVGVSYIMPFACEVLKSKKGKSTTAALTSRLSLLQHLIAEFDKEGVEEAIVEQVLTFCRPLLETPDDKVRQAAVATVVAVYKNSGGLDEDFLKMLDPKTVKALRAKFSDADDESAVDHLLQGDVDIDNFDSPQKSFSGMSGGVSVATPRNACFKKKSADVETKYGAPVAKSPIKTFTGFDEVITGNLESKIWGDREFGLKTIKEKFLSQKYEGVNCNKLWEATCDVLYISLKDKVTPVYFASLKLLQALAECCGSCLAVSSIHEALDPILPILVHRSGNMNPRITQASQEVIIDLCRKEEIGLEYTVPFTLEPLSMKKSKNQASMYIGRVELLMGLVKEFDLDTSPSLTAEELLTFSRPAMDSPDEKVRHIAVQLVVEVYRRSGNAIDEHYFDVINPKMVKKLRAKFAEAESQVDDPEAVARARMISSWNTNQANRPATSYGVEEDVGPEEFNGFGETILGELSSSIWAEREHGLKTVQTKFVEHNFKGMDCTQLWDAVCQALSNVLRDKVAPVYFASLSLLKSLAVYCAQYVPQRVIQENFDGLLPVIVYRSGNNNSRISQASIQLLIELSRVNEIAVHYVSTFVFEPLTHSKAKQKGSMYHGRLELISSLLQEFGINNTGLAVEKILTFTRPALEMPDEKVRSTAISMVVEVYKRSGHTIDENFFAVLGNEKLKKVLQAKLREADEEAQLVSSGVGKKQSLPMKGEQSMGASFSQDPSVTVFVPQRPSTRAQPAESDPARPNTSYGVALETEEKEFTGFGEITLRNLNSAVWGERELALQTIKAKWLQTSYSAQFDCTSLWDTTCQVLSNALRDKVAPVYFTSLSVMRDLVASCGRSVAPNVIKENFDGLIPMLVHRSGNLNARISQGSTQLFLHFCKTPELGLEYLVPFMFEPIVFKSQKQQVAMYIGRLELLTLVLKEFEVGSTYDLSVDKVVEFAQPALGMPDEKLRQCAINLVADVFKQAGLKQIDETAFPAVNPQTLKFLQQRIHDSAGDENAAPNNR
ncbi:hypothetical protein CYMTET_18794 [Cymbomonas tetramitiformis]|uniref:TOG domain-containing protein n=1 Tax=Cymbomonas tetramitiformis TaxID=36881 RepID=A0AAE0G7C7_9CHLO|nr:hypothetical protein CYMTET_18794 [Cymbomonas tetramitiformis]